MSSAEAWHPWSPATGTSTPGLARVIGHRGAAARAPENTLASLREAHRLGCAWVEFDVMLSRDMVPVLIHDETVDRTTDRKERVPDLTYEELRRLDAGVRFAARFRGERVPHLEEALDLCLGLGLSANVEVKPAAGFERETGRVVAETLLRRWPAGGPRLLVSSFERPSLEAALGAAPEIPRGLLAEELPADWEAAMLALRCATLNLGWRRLRPGILRELAGRGVPVLLYTVNEPWRARDLLAEGAAAVFTDAPDAVLAAVEGGGPP
jgi:glycerophosphoryl diester phosphodiesterase